MVVEFSIFGVCVLKCDSLIFAQDKLSFSQEQAKEDMCLVLQNLICDFQFANPNPELKGGWGPACHLSKMIEKQS